MKPDRPHPETRTPSPLPAALLTLAVAVVLGGGVVQAAPAEMGLQHARRVVATDRDGLGQLVAAFAQAARKLGQHHETQPALCATGPQLTETTPARRPLNAAIGQPPATTPLRAELTHLPPPALG